MIRGGSFFQYFEKVCCTRWYLVILHGLTGEISVQQSLQSFTREDSTIVTVNHLVMVNSMQQVSEIVQRELGVSAIVPFEFPCQARSCVPSKRQWLDIAAFRSLYLCV